MAQRHVSQLWNTLRLSDVCVDKNTFCCPATHNTNSATQTALLLVSVAQ